MDWEKINNYIKIHSADIIIIFLSFILSLAAFLNVIIPQDIFGWDQSHHTLYGSWIAQDIQAGNWELFWNHTHRQTLWPFLQSWILGIFFIFSGISYVSARLSHLVLYFLLLLATWQTGKALDEKNGKLIGLVGWLFIVSSSYCWMIGIDVLIEVTAALLTVCAFYCLLKLETTKKWIWIAPLGFSMAFLMVTKYNFAISAYFSILLWGIYDFFSNIRILFRKRLRTKFINLFSIKYFLIFLPSILMFFWWMFGTNSKNKWAMVWYSKSEWVAKADQVPGFWNNFIFYFKHLITTYPWAPFVGILVLIGFIGALFLIRRKNPRLIMLNLFTWGSMPIVIWIFMNKSPRYIYNIIPLIYLSSAFFWVTAYNYLKEKIGLHKARLALIPLILIILLQSGPMFSYFSGKTYKKAPGERYMDVLDYIDGKIPANAIIVSGSEIVKLSPYTFDFHFRHHSKKRSAPVYNKFSLPHVKFSKGMYLVAFIENPTPDKINNDQWYKFIESNKGKMKKIDSKFFSKLNLRTDIYLIK
jgi:4-amino-4-deoxy-L-arabinose transferase-like glycosyltransferase